MAPLWVQFFFNSSQAHLFKSTIFQRQEYECISYIIFIYLFGCGCDKSFVIFAKESWSWAAWTPFRRNLRKSRGASSFHSGCDFWGWYFRSFPPDELLLSKFTWAEPRQKWTSPNYHLLLMLHVTTHTEGSIKFGKHNGPGSSAKN